MNVTAYELARIERLASPVGIRRLIIVHPGGQIVDYMLFSYGYLYIETIVSKINNMKWYEIKITTNHQEILFDSNQEPQIKPDRI